MVKGLLLEKEAKLLPQELLLSYFKILKLMLKKKKKELLKLRKVQNDYFNLMKNINHSFSLENIKVIFNLFMLINY